MSFALGSTIRQLLWSMSAKITGVDVNPRRKIGPFGLYPLRLQLIYRAWRPLLLHVVKTAMQSRMQYGVMHAPLESVTMSASKGKESIIDQCQSPRLLLLTRRAQRCSQHSQHNYVGPVDCVARPTFVLCCVARFQLLVWCVARVHVTMLPGSHLLNQ